MLFDGSSIEGFVRIEESDMYLKPDLNTFQVLPVARRQRRHASGGVTCDIANPDGTPFDGLSAVGAEAGHRARRGAWTSA